MRNIIGFIVLIVQVTLISCKGTSSGDNTSTGTLQHFIVYQAEGRFAGWPANNGVWQFEDDEILVGFTEAEYWLNEGHNAKEPYHSWLARSRDGGETWTTRDPENYVGDFGDQPELKVIEEPINFMQPGFAMRAVGRKYHGAADPRGHFFYSYDAGQTWKGPFGFGNVLDYPELKKYGLDELTPRTDYLVTGKNTCIVFVSARIKGQFGTDRLFCIETKDGGKTFSFLGWVVKPFDLNEIHETFKVDLTDDPDKNPYATQCRAVMPHSVMLKDGAIVSVIRRKFEMEQNYNWIDAYKSDDGGKTWQFLSRVAGTGAGNGNPPSIAKTKDGRLCVVYGERTNGTIQSVISDDNGSSWNEPVVLMDGFWSEDMELNDLGYPRVVCRSDGKMAAIYYYSTKEHLHHLRATIWEP